MKYCIECSKNNVKKVASYGNVNEGTAKYCSDCSKKIIIKGKMVNYKHGYCGKIVDDSTMIFSKRYCCENANFNYPDAPVKKGTRCLEHKENGMICINGHLCTICKVQQASFIIPGSKRKTPSHCGTCIEKLNVKKEDVVHKKCRECNERIACFSLKDKNVIEYCGVCIEELNLEGVNLHHKKCLECNEKYATYGNVGESPLYCASHAKDGMIQIHKKVCEKCGITKPTYNYPGETELRFCKNCCEEGMVNVKDKLCEGCDKKRPSFNFINEKNAIFCFDCKLPEMTNVLYNKCIEENCNKHAYYNYKDGEKGIYCFGHMKPDMINLCLKLCKECSKIASFGNEGGEKEYCGIHKLEGMVDLQHDKCIVCDENRARYNNYGELNMLYCFQHKTELMVNLEHKLCKTHLCGKRSIEKYDNYCMTCYVHMNPDKPVSRNYKTKESTVVGHILSRFSDFSWVADKRIMDGCSSKRPDLLLDLGYLVLNIEIDENQHKSYEEICENKRLMLISKDIQHRNLVLIRFNPDGYTINNDKHLSCWNIGKDGLCTLKKTYQKEWNLRLKKLEDTINYWTNPKNTTDKMITVEYLFFDE